MGKQTMQNTLADIKARDLNLKFKELIVEQSNFLHLHLPTCPHLHLYVFIWY